MTTAAQLIETASRTARVTPEEQSIEPYVSARGLEIFNDILAQFGGAGVTIPMQTVVTFNTVVGQETYLSGNNPTYDINANQIIDIIVMSAYLGNVQYSMRSINETMYTNITYPSNQATPQSWLLREFIDYSAILIQPVPAQIFSIVMKCKQRLSEVTYNTVLSTIPAHWRNALKFLIARDYAIYFDLPVDPALNARAEMLLKNLKAANVVDMSIEKTERLTNNRNYFPFFWGVPQSG